MPTETIHGSVGTNGLTCEQIWHAIKKASFAVLSEVNGDGEPRSSGVVYETLGRRMYVAVGSDSWKAKHIAAHGRIAVTVTVRRGGLLSLVFPIPPATVSFQAKATVRPLGAPENRAIEKKLMSLVPPEVRDETSIIEIVPEGSFLTYGIGVPLMKMRDTQAARARVPVRGEER